MLLAIAPRLAAQPALVWRDSAERLVARVRALRDSMLQGDSTVHEVARRGDLVIGSSEALRGVAAQALARFVEARNHWFGDAAPSVGGFRIVLRGTESMSRWPFDQSKVNTVILAELPDTGASARIQRSVSNRQMASALIDLYADMMWASAGKYAVLWLSPAPPLSMPEQERRYAAMYTVVTGTGTAQRRCLAGSVPDCAYALGLRPAASEKPGGTYPQFVRADLLLTALEIGGSQAWQRFRSAAGPRLEPALASAAATPSDSLIARWRGQLLAMRPTETPIAARGVLLLIAWTAAVLVGAVGVARWA